MKKYFQERCFIRCRRKAGVIQRNKVAKSNSLTSWQPAQWDLFPYRFWATQPNIESLKNHQAMTRTTFLFISIISLMYLSCFSQKEALPLTGGGADYCEDLLNLIIKPNWKEDEKGQYYMGDTIRCFVGTKKYWERAIIANQSCFKGKSKEYMETILGKPNKEWKFKNGNTGVKYSICSDSRYGPEWHIQINYDKRLRVMNITDAVTSIHE